MDITVVDDALAYLGCRADVVTLDPRTLDEVLATVAELGRRVDQVAAAKRLVADLRLRLEVVVAAVAGRPAVRTMVLEWTDPPFAPGHWVPEMVTLAGGSAVLGVAGERSERTSWDAIAAARPEVVVSAPCGYDLPGSVKLAEEAVANRLVPQGIPVWAVDANASFARPGPRLVDGVEALAAVLHPGAGVDLDPHLAQRVSA